VCLEVEADTETPVSAFLKLSSGEEQAFLLESAPAGSGPGRWSLLGARPRASRAFGPLDSAGTFDFLEAALSRYKGVRLPGAPPFTGGLLGYLAYDLVRHLEPSVPVTGASHLGFPEAQLMDFDATVAFDARRMTMTVVAQARCREGDDPGALYDEALARIAGQLRALRRPLPAQRDQRDQRGQGAGAPELRACGERAAFERAVARARELVRGGDAQQIVLSQRFEAESGMDPFSIYRALRRINPSPYLYFVRDGQRALVGASPETMVKVAGRDITLRPIAGTRRRGRDEAEDLRLEGELLADAKENAEHMMLVDLGRNDAGRVAQPGTVRVTQLRGVERYSHVMHMVSEVRARLAPGQGPLDAVRAAFPAGTVSGSPKVRAMQIIDELEPGRRGPYAGCVGYFDHTGDIDVAIAIRTLFCAGRRLSVQAGAGVVLDSSPAAEHDETVAKAGALFSAARAAHGRAAPPDEGGLAMARVLIIDNYDSFTWNIVQYLAELGAHVDVARNDDIDTAGIAALAPDGLLLSPGPGDPDRAGVTLGAIRAFAGRIPLLGVCLGHQAIGQAFGGVVVRAREIVHGRASRVAHQGEGVFEGLPSPLLAGRYHSLALDAARLPPSLAVTAAADDGEIMAVRHRELEVEGVQFHPESILTQHGMTMLGSWLGRLGRPGRPGRPGTLRAPGASPAHLLSQGNTQ
jgi:anthranilate synthase component I